MKIQVRVLVLTAGLMTASAAVFAHHSESINDQNRLVAITGTVTQFGFTNPHANINLDVQDANGNVEHWVATGGGPSAMRRLGWTNTILKVGETITITGFPYKDGRNVLFWLKLERPNGEVLPVEEAITGRLERFLALHPNQKAEVYGVAEKTKR
jgi:Family of unknown function (DUF6152)